MTESSFGITELVNLFRDAMVALLPVMDRARITWHLHDKWDPWEKIEKTLYEEIIGSCLENASPHSLLPLPPYSIYCKDVGKYSLIVDSSSNPAQPLVLFDLETQDSPFDTARLLRLEAGRKLDQELILRPLRSVEFSLASRSADGGDLTFCREIIYFD